LQGRTAEAKMSRKRITLSIRALSPNPHLGRLFGTDLSVAVPRRRREQLMLHDVEGGDGEDDDGHQFHNHDPASLAPSAQADGDDNQHDGDDQQEHRDHADASMRAKSLRVTYRFLPQERSQSFSRVSWHKTGSTHVSQGPAASKNLLTTLPSRFASRRQPV